MTRTLLAASVVATLALGHGFIGVGALAQDAVEPVRVGGNIRVPKKIKDVRPVYPPEALQLRVRGIVIVEAVIDTDGKVRNARVSRSVPLLDRAALDAVLQWEFETTLLNEVPVPVIMSVTVNFQLDGPGGDTGPGGSSGTGVGGAGNPAGAGDPVAPTPAGERPEPVASQCLIDGTTPGQASRREAVIKFLEDVNAKQRTVFIARQGTGYAPRLDQLPGLPKLEGYDVQLVAADRAYSISVKEKTDVCALAFFSDQTGSIYTALRTR